MFTLEVLGQRRQLRKRHLEAARDPSHVAPGGIDATRLDVGDPGRMDLRMQAQRLLTELDLGPQLADREAEAYLRVVTAGHLLEGMRLLPPRP